MHGRGPAPYGYAYAGEDEDGSIYARILDELPRALNVECSEPGRYFVSVRREDGAFRFVAGPFTWQMDALRALPIIKAECKDPRAAWYAWGTARER
jgi:hypothetical protein